MDFSTSRLLQFGDVENSDSDHPTRKTPNSSPDILEIPPPAATMEPAEDDFSEWVDSGAVAVGSYKAASWL